MENSIDLRKNRNTQTTNVKRVNQDLKGGFILVIIAITIVVTMRIIFPNLNWN